MRKREKTKNHFENWYFRLVDINREQIIGILVGTIEGEQETQAFIQVMREGAEDSICMSYPLESAKHMENGMEIDGNIFTTERIQLDLQEEKFALKGEVLFGHHKDLKQSFWKPGLMGPFKYLPFQESYHEVVSLQNTLTGSLTLNDKYLSFNEGKGYIEKDWGKSFPKVWLWAQCNHFKKYDMAIMIGVARLPLFLEYYTSFAIPILRDDKLEIFSNYNGGHIAKLYRYKGYVHLIITQKNKILDFKIYGNDEISCVISKSTHMIRDVYACDNAKIEIKMMEDNEVVFEDIGYCCDLEMGGNTSKLK